MQGEAPLLPRRQPPSSRPDSNFIEVRDCGMSRFNGEYWPDVKKAASLRAEQSKLARPYRQEKGTGTLIFYKTDQLWMLEDNYSHAFYYCEHPRVTPPHSGWEICKAGKAPAPSIREPKGPLHWSTKPK